MIFKEARNSILLKQPRYYDSLAFIELVSKQLGYENDTEIFSTSCNLRCY